MIGPELGFGWTMGDYLDEDVLIIKTAWGGKSIDRDFRPPSRGYPESITQMFENANKRNADLTLEDYKKTYGRFYRLMIDEVKKSNRRHQDLCSRLPRPGIRIGGFCLVSRLERSICADVN